MLIAWHLFTPWSALLGGALIGLAASLFVLLNGRVAGISGILGGLMAPAPADVGWRVAFLGGLVGAPVVAMLVAAPPEVQVDASYGSLILAGLLVGLGTRYGSGCTSGHGVCGIARFSMRSLFATALFMAAGIATVFVTRHVI
jgi:uncharacterized membrane protein YedE/YeeE